MFVYSKKQELSQVELELRVLEALEIYPPSKLQGFSTFFHSNEKRYPKIQSFLNSRLLGFLNSIPPHDPIKFVSMLHLYVWFMSSFLNSMIIWYEQGVCFWQECIVTLFCMD